MPIVALSIPSGWRERNEFDPGRTSGGTRSTGQSPKRLLRTLSARSIVRGPTSGRFRIRRRSGDISTISQGQGRQLPHLMVSARPVRSSADIDLPVSARAGRPCVGAGGAIHESIVSVQFALPSMRRAIGRETPNDVASAASRPDTRVAIGGYHLPGGTRARRRDRDISGVHEAGRSAMNCAAVSR